MTSDERIITILIAALATALTRFLPFLIFKPSRPTPKYLKFFATALPPAVFGMLVIYCFKGISFSSASTFIPELIATIIVVAVHLCFRKMLLSISAGTAAYMILINLIFI